MVRVEAILALDTTVIDHITATHTMEVAIRPIAILKIPNVWRKQDNETLQQGYLQDLWFYYLS